MALHNEAALSRFTPDLTDPRYTSSSLSPSAKIIMLTSEGGSLTLRTESEGGGMYGHHGSKAAGNMVGKLLGYDLKKSGVPIAMIHVSCFDPDEMGKSWAFETVSSLVFSLPGFCP
jgi:hypothetical protein